jgi:hypothetical protein
MARAHRNGLVARVVLVEMVVLVEVGAAMVGMAGKGKVVRRWKCTLRRARLLVPPRTGCLCR